MVSGENWRHWDGVMNRPRVLRLGLSVRDYDSSIGSEIPASPQDWAISPISSQNLELFQNEVVQP